MNAHHRLLGIYVPGASVLHRLPAGWKIVTLGVVTLVTMLAQRWWVSVGWLALLLLGLLLVARIPWRVALWPGLLVVVVVGGLSGYQLITSTWSQAVMVAGNLLAAVYGGRLLVCTTPVPAVVEAVRTGTSPLRHVGVNPEYIGLAVGIMLRSLPYLVATFDDVRTAARARGLDTNPIARVTPVVVHAVAYAQATGDALAARGIGDD